MTRAPAAFCVGTGRCGTTFLTRVAAAEPGDPARDGQARVAASHERLRLAATFHMYCKWNGIPVDPEGFLVDRDRAVAEDLARAAVSFEASALLSHSLAELNDRFDARFLLLVRSPAHTVASFVVRGWFTAPIARADRDLPPSYREGEEPRHFFGRNIPKGEAFTRWSALTPLGRLGWFWTARNRAVLDQMRGLPADRCRIERLEDLDWERYRDLTRFLGWESGLSEDAYAAIARERPNAGPNPARGPAAWTPTEAAEFEAEVGTLAEAFGYEHRVDRLVAPGAPVIVRPEPLAPRSVVARLDGGRVGG